MDNSNLNPAAPQPNAAPVGTPPATPAAPSIPVSAPAQPVSVPQAQAAPTIPIVKPGDGSNFGKALAVLGAITAVSFILYMIAYTLIPKTGIEEIVGKWDCGKYSMEGVSFDFDLDLEEDGMKLTQTTSLYNYTVTTDVDYEFLKKFIDGNDTVYVVKFSKIRTKDSEGKSSTSTVGDDIGLYFRLNDSSKKLSFQMSENTISCKRSN